MPQRGNLPVQCMFLQRVTKIVPGDCRVGPSGLLAMTYELFPDGIILKCFQKFTKYKTPETVITVSGELSINRHIGTGVHFSAVNGLRGGKRIGGGADLFVFFL